MTVHGHAIGERRRRERRTCRAYRFFERRTGFDRRLRHPVLGALRDNPRLLLFLLVLVNVLSLFDGALTVLEVSMGIAVEGNPILRAAAERHLLLAGAIKIGAVLLVSLGIWHGRRHCAIVAVTFVALAAFTGVVAYHLGSLAGMGFP